MSPVRLREQRAAFSWLTHVSNVDNRFPYFDTATTWSKSYMSSPWWNWSAQIAIIQPGSLGEACCYMVLTIISPGQDYKWSLSSTSHVCYTVSLHTGIPCTMLSGNLAGIWGVFDVLRRSTTTTARPRAVCRSTAVLHCTRRGWVRTRFGHWTFAAAAERRQSFAVEMARKCCAAKLSRVCRGFSMQGWKFNATETAVQPLVEAEYIMKHQIIEYVYIPAIPWSVYF